MALQFCTLHSVSQCLSTGVQRRFEIRVRLYTISQRFRNSSDNLLISTVSSHQPVTLYFVLLLQQ